MSLHLFLMLINSLLHMLCWGNSIVICAELWRVSMETKYLKSGAISAFVPYTGNTCYWYQSKFKFSSFNCSQFIAGILADSAVYNLCMVHCVLIKFWIENGTVSSCIPVKAVEMFLLMMTPDIYHGDWYLQLWLFLFLGLFCSLCGQFGSHLLPHK